MKRKSVKKGISLIVLVITIIVMVILAGAIILTLNNSGIINKASDAVEETNLATIKEVASLAWAEAYADGARTQEELEEAVENKLKEIKVDTAVYKVTVTTSGVTVEKNAEEDEEENSNVIPVGAKYYLANSTATTICPECSRSATLNEFFNYAQICMNCDASLDYPEPTYKEKEQFPVPTDGDIFIYGDYQYRYNTHWDAINSGGWKTDTSMNGWGVCVIDNYKASYEPILETIGEKPIVSLSECFYGCSQLTVAPAIPGTVKNMNLTFANCSKLSDVSGIVIPESVTTMWATFNYCTSLITAPTIPSSVTLMDDTFYNCSSLAGDVTINATPTSYINCFYGTVKNITIKGSCSSAVKSNLASTANNNNVAY